MQDELLVYGGENYRIGYVNSLYSFDFKSLSWSKAKLMGDPWHPRCEGMTAHHDGALLGMAGQHQAACISV